jgi:hypothetical protein
MDAKYNEKHTVEIGGDDPIPVKAYAVREASPDRHIRFSA